MMKLTEREGLKELKAAAHTPDERCPGLIDRVGGCGVLDYLRGRDRPAAKWERERYSYFDHLGAYPQGPGFVLGEHQK